LSGDFINNGTFTHGNGTVYLDGSAARTIKGSSSTTFYNLTKNTTAQLTIGDPSTVGNTIKVAGTFNWTDNNDIVAVGNGVAVTFETDGNMSINDGCSLTSTAVGTIKVGGNWSNAGTFISGGGTVVFDPTSGYTTLNSGGTSATKDFDHIEISTNGGSGIQLITNNLTVGGNIIFTNGNVDLNGRYITLCATCNLSGETENKRIFGTSGYVQITKNLSTPNNVNPGNLGAYITSSSNLGSTNIKRGHSPQTSLGNQNILRYFDITPTTNTGINATLKFTYFDTELNGQVEENLVLYRSTDLGVTWENRGADIADYITNYVQKGAINSFSRWTISNRETNPLPIELISYNVTLNNGVVFINWNTSSETNNEYFTIEKSIDGKEWNFFLKVNGSGNSNSTINYLEKDRKPYSPITYYRLSQIDFDGSKEILGIRSVNMKENGMEEKIKIYPNPSEIEVFVEIMSNKEQKAIMTIVNMYGQKMRKELIDLNNELNIICINIENLNTGQYILYFENTEGIPIINKTFNVK